MIARSLLLALAAATTFGACAQIAGLSDFERASEDDETNTGAGGDGAGALGGGGAGEGGTGAGGSVACNTDDLVISEIRTEGTAGLKDDFVEIFNPTSSPIDLGG